MKILKSVFSEATAKDDLNAWTWDDINTKKINRQAVVSLMLECQSIDPRLFHKMRFNEFSDRKIQVKLASNLISLKESVKKIGERVGHVTMNSLFDDGTINSFELEENLLELINMNYNYKKRKMKKDNNKMDVSKTCGIIISSESISKFNSKK